MTGYEKCRKELLVQHKQMHQKRIDCISKVVDKMEASKKQQELYLYNTDVLIAEFGHGLDYHTTEIDKIEQELAKLENRV